MTLAPSGASSIDTPSYDSNVSGTDAMPTVKTALDCDILTLARDARAHAESAHNQAGTHHDPMDALYKPLANKDVACVLKATGR